MRCREFKEHLHPISISWNLCDGFWGKFESWRLSKLAHTFPYFSHIRSIERDVVEFIYGADLSPKHFLKRHLWWESGFGELGSFSRAEARRSLGPGRFGRVTRKTVGGNLWERKRSKCPQGYEGYENTDGLPKLLWSMACPIWLLSYSWSWLEFATIKLVLFNNCDRGYNYIHPPWVGIKATFSRNPGQHGGGGLPVISPTLSPLKLFRNYFIPKGHADFFSLSIIRIPSLGNRRKEMLDSTNPWSA